MAEEIKTTEEVKKRQIIIETNGNEITLVKAEVAGALELKAILQGLLENLQLFKK